MPVVRSDWATYGRRRRLEAWIAAGDTLHSPGILSAVAGRGTGDGTPDRGAPFGKHLRRLRKIAGLTQEELAARAGLTPHAVSALECGLRKRPYPHTVRALADALRLTDGERADLVASVPRRGDAATAPAAVTRPVLPAHPFGRA